MQCTSCHDSHADVHGNFLKTTDLRSRLCLACHQPEGWSTAAHSVSTARWNGSGTNPWPAARYQTVANNACANCHRSHGAGRPARLQTFPLEEDNCLHCHNGNVAATDIRADIRKFSAHSPLFTVGVHDPVEDPRSMPRHAECSDCHDPHEARAGRARPPNVPGPLVGVSGIDSTGSPVARIRFGHELCYKCHSDDHGTTTSVSRVIKQANIRLEFQPQNPSFHPIETTGRNPDVPSLLPPWTTASRMACTDCHQSDSSPDFGGSGAAGAHGSIYRPLLGANYETRDGLPETSHAYALCYRCHSRSSILNGDSFKYHREHVVDGKASCAACHDAHGISASQGSQLNNSHLINFDARIVGPNDGRIEFVDLGSRRGSCTLTCHGVSHRDWRY